MTIRLDRYSLVELVDIIEGRTDIGVRSGKVAGGAVEAMADPAAGNARLAIAMLRHGAMHVEAGQADELTPAVVDAVEREAEELD